MSEKRIGYHLLAFAVVAVWGVTFISTKVLINAGLPPAWIFALRFIIAYAGIWLFCLKSGSRVFSKSLRDELVFALGGVTGGSVYFLAENSALVYTQACNVSFIVCTAPLITAMLTLFFRRMSDGELSRGLENISGRRNLIVGSVLALAGVAAVVFDGVQPCPLPVGASVGDLPCCASAGDLSGGAVKGDLLAVAAALCWGVYSILMGQMTSRYGTLFATRKVFFYGLVTIVPFLAGGLPDPAVFSRSAVWLNLLFLSLVASLACFVLWNKVLAEIGNVTATNYVYLNPFFTFAAAVVFLGESLTVQSGIGSLAIVAGVVIGGLHPKIHRL